MIDEEEEDDPIPGILEWLDQLQTKVDDLSLDVYDLRGLRNIAMAIIKKDDVAVEVIKNEG